MRRVRISKPDGTGIDKEAEWVVVNEAGYSPLPTPRTTELRTSAVVGTSGNQDRSRSLMVDSGPPRGWSAVRHQGRSKVGISVEVVDRS